MYGVRETRVNKKRGRQTNRQTCIQTHTNINTCRFDFPKDPDIFNQILMTEYEL